MSETTPQHGAEQAGAAPQGRRFGEEPWRPARETRAQREWKPGQRRRQRAPHRPPRRHRDGDGNAERRPQGQPDQRFGKRMARGRDQLAPAVPQSAGDAGRAG